eukprot:105423-Chlamydomonas_euryale.AAC.1
MAEAGPEAEAMAVAVARPAGLCGSWLAFARVLPTLGWTAAGEADGGARLRIPRGSANAAAPRILDVATKVTAHSAGAGRSGRARKPARARHSSVAAHPSVGARRGHRQEDDC